MTGHAGENQDSAGTPLEQVQAMAEHVESLATQVRSIDNEKRLHLFTLDRGVTEPYAFGDVLDVIAMGLRLIEGDMRGQSRTQDPL